MKRLFLFLFLLAQLNAGAQVKLCIDSVLTQAYRAKYGMSEGLMCVPFYCDPFCKINYKKTDTAGLCGRMVFVDKNNFVKIKAGFELPCWFEPKFSENLCAVSIGGQIAFIDTLGVVKIKTGLSACSNQKNYVRPFKNGKSKVYKGSGGLKNTYDVFYIDNSGKRIPYSVAVKVKIKPIPKPPILAVRGVKDTMKFAGNIQQHVKIEGNAVNTPVKEEYPIPAFELPSKVIKGKYPMKPENLAVLKAKTPHKNNRMLVFFECGQYQYENMHAADTAYCNKFVFTDSALNIKISGGFKLPCNFEPEFSEGLCAVSVANEIVYIDTNGNVMIRTGLLACDSILNKASTFRNGIATLYIGDKSIKGLYTTIAINTRGERVRLLEFDDLDLAETKIGLFRNLTPEESVNCFVGRAKNNGYWFLIEKTGKVRKKLELK